MSYNKLTVVELKAELRDRELPVSGNKSELIARLQEDDDDKNEDGFCSSEFDEQASEDEGEDSGSASESEHENNTNNSNNNINNNNNDRSVPMPSTPPNKKLCTISHVSHFQQLVDEFNRASEYKIITATPEDKPFHMLTDYDVEAEEAIDDKKVELMHNCLNNMADVVRKAVASFENERITAAEKHHFVQEFDRMQKVVLDRFHSELNAEDGSMNIEPYGVKDGLVIKSYIPVLSAMQAIATSKFYQKPGEPPDMAKAARLSTMGNPYSSAFRPSNNTSPLIRTTSLYSKQDLANLAAPLKIQIDNDKLSELHKLTALYEGRAEVKFEGTDNPCAMRSAGDILAIATRSGDKERYGGLVLYDNGDSDGEEEQKKNDSDDDSDNNSDSDGAQDSEDDEPKRVDPGFYDGGSGLYLDEPHNIVWQTGDERIKGFIASGKARGTLKYTLCAVEDIQPVIVIGDMLLASAKDTIYMWDINKLTAHTKACYNEEEDGEYAIGGTLGDDCTGMEEDQVELSIGEAPDQMVQVPFKIAYWAKCYHDPASPSSSIGSTQLLIATEYNYSLSLLDLNDLQHYSQHPKVTFVGHSKPVTSITTSPLFPDTVITTCWDRYTRIFKFGDCFPHFALECGSNTVTAATATVINGNMFVFTGTSKAEVKCWDLTSKKCILELSAGNCGVIDMHFHAPNQTLFIALECDTVDRNGFNHDYMNVVVDGEHEEYHHRVATEADKTDDEGILWPEQALYTPSYFGRPFDCTGHGLLQYKFAIDAGNVVPQSGKFGGSGLY